jgi:hypothetical protein
MVVEAVEEQELLEPPERLAQLVLLEPVDILELTEPLELPENKVLQERLELELQGQKELLDRPEK